MIAETPSDAPSTCTSVPDSTPQGGSDGGAAALTDAAAQDVDDVGSRDQGHRQRGDTEHGQDRWLRHVASDQLATWIAGGVARSWVW